MASRIYFTLYFLLAIGSPILAQPVWEQSDLLVKQGDTVTVDCSVDLGGDPFGVVRVARINDDEDNKGINEIAILDGETIKSPFDFTGRYSVVYNLENGVGKVKLTFQDIRGEDGGKLVCYSIDDDTQVATIKINVQVPVHEIYMVKISDANEVQAANGATVHLKQGQPSGVGCVVKMDGSLQAPEIVLTVDGADETNMFTKLENSQKIEALNGGPKTYSTEVKYTYVNVKPTAEFNQKNLSCKAVAEGFPAVTASVFLDVKYEPVITCPKYEHYAKVEGSVTISCVLRSNPGATVSWSYGPEEEGATPVDPGTTPGMTTKEKPFDEDKTDISLTISSVNEMSFTKYYLTASNAIGKSSVFVTLHKEADQVQGSSSSSLLRSSDDILLAHLCMLLALLAVQL